MLRVRVTVHVIRMSHFAVETHARAAGGQRLIAFAGPPHPIPIRPDLVYEEKP